MKKTSLEITDLPQDSLNVLYGVRKPLVKAFNKCRDYPYKMKLLKEFLKFMYNKCVEFEKHSEQLRIEAEKAAEIAEKAAIKAEKEAEKAKEKAKVEADKIAAKETSKSK